MSVPDLPTLGWDEGWDDAFAPYRADGLTPARVAVPHRGAYDVLADDGEIRAQVAPRLRREASAAELPVVGDWVALAADVIEAVLPRRTAFVRRAAADPGTGAAREQVVAANVDVVFVTAALGQDLDRLVLERYVTLALQSGAQPVLLLTKADLEEDPAAVAADIEGIGDAIPVHFVSARAGVGLEHVRALVAPGVTGHSSGRRG